MERAAEYQPTTSDDTVGTADASTNVHDSENEIQQAAKFLAERGSQDQNFTLRGVLVGLVIGVIICFSNMYFGLQTGWVSGMAMPAALVGFAFFKSIAKHIKLPFTPVENVLVQTVAGAVGTMPLGCGFVGVIPALEFLLKKNEGGPLNLSLWRLMLWAVGVCFFGVFIAVPLRREVLIREKLKFPSGTATALMIGVLHGEMDVTERSCDKALQLKKQSTSQSSSSDDDQEAEPRQQRHPTGPEEISQKDDWHSQIRTMILAFSASGLYVCFSSTYLPDKFMLMITDASLVLLTIPSSFTSIGDVSGSTVALDIESFSGVRRSRYYHGTSDNSPHVPRSLCRLGHSVTTCTKSRLGSRTSCRLGDGIERLDRVGQPGHHAGRFSREPWLAAVQGRLPDHIWPTQRLGQHRQAKLETIIPGRLLFTGCVHCSSFWHSRRALEAPLTARLRASTGTYR